MKGKGDRGQGKERLFFTLVLILLSGPLGLRQPFPLSPVTSPLAFPLAQTQPSARTHVETLASERFDGRATGTAGATLAASYIVDQLKAIGARPLPGQPDFRLPFEFTSGIKDDGSVLTIKHRDDAVTRYAGTDTFRALSFSDSGTVTGGVVFAGYGIVVPPTGSFAYDSYGTLNVKDKIVVVLRYSPEDAGQGVRTLLARYSSLRFKAREARDRGARGVIVVTGPRSSNAGKTIAMTFDSAVAGSGLAAATASGAVAEAIFAHASGRTLAEVQQALDTGNPHVPGFEIPGLELTLDMKVSRQRKTDHNVVGYLPGNGGAVKKPYVVIGAHYDHLGRGTYGDSLARGAEIGAIHYGADDNASGVAATLAAGSLLAPRQRERGIVLAFWSGEELGLLGSNEFVKKPPIASDQIAAYLNLDMVGRMRANTLAIQATGTSPAWPQLIDEVNTSTKFVVQKQDDPYLPTDVSSFNPAGIPSLSFFTGSHSEYHRPTDVAATINYADLDRVAQFVALLAERIANAPEPPEFVKVTRRMQGAGDRAAIRLYTGTIPDYASEAKGLKLGGVMEGGPAARAGLQEGDVIVEFGGRTVANIYDYMYALEAAKAGQSVTVVYIRNGEKRQTTLTPEARK